MGTGRQAGRHQLFGTPQLAAQCSRFAVEELLGDLQAFTQEAGVIVDAGRHPIQLFQVRGEPCRLLPDQVDQALPTQLVGRAGVQAQDALELGPQPLAAPWTTNPTADRQRLEFSLKRLGHIHAAMISTVCAQQGGRRYPSTVCPSPTTTRSAGRTGPCRGQVSPVAPQASQTGSPKIPPSGPPLHNGQICSGPSH